MRDVLETFKRHTSDVDRLMAFDREVMQIAVATVEELHNRLVKQQRIENEQLNGARALQILRGIRDNETLKPRFSLILNQAIVLLVSYFGSAVEDIFCYAVNASLRGNSSSRLKKEELKLTVAELLEAVANSDGDVAALFIEKKDLSFQDMQAIQRAFRDYVGVDMGKDTTVNNIILAQAQPLMRQVLPQRGLLLEQIGQGDDAQLLERLFFGLKFHAPNLFAHLPAVGLP
jgi:hypothetical protein